MTRLPSPSPVNALLIYLVIVSLVSLIVCVADKLLAILRMRRVPEAVLFLLALLGGSFAMFLAMLLIRHKIRKPRFMLGLPLIMILQAAVVFVICYHNVL